MEKTKSRKGMDVNTLVKAAFLVALSVVLTRFLSIMIPIGGAQGVRVGFGGMPITIAGLLFGPVVGGIAGFASDFLGVLINPMGSFHPGFMLTATLGGVIPGLYSLYFQKHKVDGHSVTIPRVFVAQLTNSILLSLVLNTLWLTQLYGEGFIFLLPPRIISSAVNLPIQTIVNYNVVKQLERFS